MEIEKAENEIFITDWWLSPKLHMIRPVCLEREEESIKTRLDMVLLAAAERGVKIYILHWAGSKYAAPFNSQVIKEYLMGLHPNIKMMRHPRDAIALWS